MERINPKQHEAFEKYRSTMQRIISSLYPQMNIDDINDAINYSIAKRFNNFNLSVQNNYTGTNIELTMLEMLDYISKRQPIITSYGTLFKRHEDVPNPMGKVIQSFLDLRKQHKKEMFKYPKGSEMFEHFNLLQTLDKIDVNGIYGLIGLYASVLYDPNISPAVTSTGRSLISSAIMCFEGFLGNNVKFGSLNDILTFIDNIRKEYCQWKFSDEQIIGIRNFISPEECFNKIILNCGYKYIPSTEDLDIVWRIIQGCNAIELNRLFYKNNLYCFMDIPIARELMVNIITKMKRPYIEPADPPKEILDDLNKLRDLLVEYVFYCYQYIDRIMRNKEMIKTISIVSDTDSSFVSLDAWYHYNIEYLKHYDCPILHQSIDNYKFIEAEKKREDYTWKNQETPEWYEGYDKDPVASEIPKDEFGDYLFHQNIIEIVEPDKDYDFYNEDVIEKDRVTNLLKTTPQDNMKFALINIMCYILSTVINLYMIDFTKQSGSYRSDSLCKINMKNEFYMSRILLTTGKKHYASLQILQEGNYLGSGILDVKGIDCLTKSSTSKDTQKALRKILLEDILTAEPIDQLKLIKDIAILEKTIYNDLKSGSKKYYKPVTIKSMDNYDNPIRIQGIKAAMAWNYIKGDLPGFDLNDRNSLDVIKLHVDKYIIETIKETHPDIYMRMMDIIDSSQTMYEGIPICNIFHGTLDSIGLPKDLPVPEWLKPFIDYEQIITDNISGFPLSSVGICQFGAKKANYSNVIKL